MLASCCHGSLEPEPYGGLLEEEGDQPKKVAAEGSGLGNSGGDKKSA